jgi:hypothetical protein
MNLARKTFFIWAIFLIVSIAFASAVCANMLQDPSFETLGPNGSSTSFTGFLDGGSPKYSAAQDWLVWNNTSGTTATELLPTTLPGGGVTMIHVTTDEAMNGLFQPFLPYQTGPDHAIGSAWIYVISGQVAIGTGNDGSTGFDTFTSTIGVWKFLEAPNGISPANEFIIYSKGGPAEFYAENASVTPAPEPVTMILLGSGLIGLLGLRRKLNK